MDDLQRSAERLARSERPQVHRACEAAAWVGIIVNVGLIARMIAGCTP